MKTTITKLCLLLLLAAGSTAAQPLCIASFTSSLDSSGYGVIVNNTSIGSFTNVQWSFGDGSGSTQMNPPVHFYNVNGPVQICLTVYDTAGNCQSSTCDTITVGNPAGGNCNVSFGYQSSGLGATFNASLSGLFGPATYSWDFGDNTSGTGQFPQHTYLNAGTYNVCVTAVTASGCTSTFCNSVTVGTTTGCNSFFTYNITSTVLNVVQFSDQSNGAQSWYWDFGDGSTSSMPNPMHTYAAPGTYTVCLTINNPGSPCSDTYCTTVSVGINTTCSAIFGYQNVQMSYSFYSQNPNYQHSWSFGDGTFSFASNPTHVYGTAGTYPVCHTVSDSASGCSDTWCDTIVISTGGTCNVSYTYTTDSTGTLYTFSASSFGVLGQYIWSFGDGTGGSGPSVTHQFNSSGNYTVCVSVVAPSGVVLCSYCDTIGSGNPSPCIPVFYSFADSNALGNGNVNFGIYNPCGNMQFTWDFGDGSVGAGINPAHVYADSGWYYVCVTAGSPAGIYTFCDSVYAFRLSTSVNENGNAAHLMVYPNPLSGNGILSLELRERAAVRVAITDMQGRLIKEILNGMQESGLHNVSIDGSALRSGIYLVNTEVNGILYSNRLSVQ